MDIFVLDHRSPVEDSRSFDTTVAFVGSSVESCLEFIKANPDYDEPKNHWWWVVCKHVLDSHEITDDMGLVAIFDKDGNELDNQPLYNHG